MWCGALYRITEGNMSSSSTSSSTASCSTDYQPSSHPTTRWPCPLCPSFASRKLKGVVRHIGRVHAHDANFHICCGVDGCHRTYSKFVSYKKHMYDVHLKSQMYQSMLVDNVTDGTTDDASDEGDVDIGPTSHHTPPAAGLVPCNSKRSSSLFLMKLENEFKMSSSSLDCLLEDINELLESTTESLKAKLAMVLSSKQINFDEDIASVFENSVNPFNGLHSEYLRLKYYATEMNLLVS